MPLIILVPILAVAAVGGYYYGRGTKKPVEETALRRAQDTAREATGKAKGWLGKLGIGRRKKEAQRFREWAAGLPGGTKAFAAWLEGLSPQQAETLAQRVASFGSGLKVNLAWLLDGQMDTDPELKQQLVPLCYRQAWIAAAPIVVVACSVPTRGGVGGYADSRLVDVTIAVDHLTLAAAAEGLGTCWIGAFENEGLKTLLDMPADANVVAVTPLGYPESPISVPTKERRPLDETTSWDRWGPHDA